MGVLILVLMEDALVRKWSVKETRPFSGLNPCFNGRCTRTPHVKLYWQDGKSVLILVLMEDALVLTG